MTTTEEKISIMQAFVDGDQVRYRKKGTADSHRQPSTSGWMPTGKPSWNWESNDYQVIRRVWTNVYPVNSYGTKEEADENAGLGRLCCVPVDIVDGDE